MKKISLLLLAALLLPLGGTFAKDLDALTDLKAALEVAAKEQKSLFIMYGREACGNCKALRGLLEKKDVRLPKTSFVIVELNCDDPAVSKEFRARYKVEGDTLPFVVMAKPDGTQVAARSGYGTAAEYNDFVKDARKELK